METPPPTINASRAQAVIAGDNARQTNHFHGPTRWQRIPALSLTLVLVGALGFGGWYITSDQKGGLGQPPGGWPSMTPTAPGTQSPSASPTASGTVPDTATPGPTSTTTISPTMPPVPAPPPVADTILAYAATERAHGLTFDGTYLWISDQSTNIFKMTLQGELLTSYSAPHPTPHGITWDGSAFWLYVTSPGGIDRFVINGSTGQQTGHLESPGASCCGSEDLTPYSGSLLYADELQVYQLNTTTGDATPLFAKGNPIRVHRFYGEPFG